MRQIEKKGWKGVIKEMKRNDLSDNQIFMFSSYHFLFDETLIRKLEKVAT